MSDKTPPIPIPVPSPTLGTPRPQDLGVLSGGSQTPSGNTAVSDTPHASDKSENKSYSRIPIEKDNKENKDGKGKLRLTKLLTRNRAKQAEEESLDSSKTADTGSSLSNDSSIDQRKQATSKLPNIANHLKRLIKLKNQKDIKTEDKVIIVAAPEVVPVVADNVKPSVPELESISLVSTSLDLWLDILPTLENPIAAHEDPFQAPTPPTSPVTPQRPTSIGEYIIENGVVMEVMATSPATPVTPAVPNLLEDVENVNEVPLTTGDPMILAAALTAQLGAQAETQISRRGRERQDLPLVYLQDEARVEPYTENMLNDEQGSNATGSENSSVSEVAGSDLQRQGPDEAQQYYDAALRAAVRKQFRHLDDEPPIY